MRYRNGIQRPEIKIHAFFSQVGREEGLSTEDIAMIYDQYLNRMKSQIPELKAMQIYMKGLGRLLVSKPRLIKSTFYCLGSIKHSFDPNEEAGDANVERRATMLFDCIEFLSKYWEQPRYLMKKKGKEEIKQLFLEDLPKINFPTDPEYYIDKPNLLRLKEIQDEYNKGIYFLDWAWHS